MLSGFTTPGLKLKLSSLSYKRSNPLGTITPLSSQALPGRWVLGGSAVFSQHPAKAASLSAPHLTLRAPLVFHFCDIQLENVRAAVKEAPHRGDGSAEIPVYEFFDIGAYSTRRRDAKGGRDSIIQSVDV